MLARDIASREFVKTFLPVHEAFLAYLRAEEAYSAECAGPRAQMDEKRDAVDEHARAFLRKHAEVGLPPSQDIVYATWEHCTLGILATWMAIRPHTPHSFSAQQTLATIRQAVENEASNLRLWATYVRTGRHPLDQHGGGSHSVEVM